MLWQWWYSVLEFLSTSTESNQQNWISLRLPQYFSVSVEKRDCQDDLQQLILKMSFLSLAVNAECNVDWLSLEQIS